jgi:hypothetical protein
VQDSVFFTFVQAFGIVSQTQNPGIPAIAIAGIPKKIQQINSNREGAPGIKTERGGRFHKAGRGQAESTRKSMVILETG